MKMVALLSLVCLMAFSSCKKDIKSLPDETQTGAGTFGAKVDGENWGPLKFGIVPTAPILEARFGGVNGVFINARNFSRSPVETEMEIYIQNITDAGTYPLNQATAIYPSQSASYGYYLKRNVNPIEEWTTNSTTTGTVTITKFDRGAKIISGTFQFTGTPRYGTTPVAVTEGRFDIKIQ